MDKLFDLLKRGHITDGEFWKYVIEIKNGGASPLLPVPDPRGGLVKYVGPPFVATQPPVTALPVDLDYDNYEDYNGY